jgi:hypothetical protein
VLSDSDRASTLEQLEKYSSNRAFIHPYKNLLSRFTFKCNSNLTFIYLWLHGRRGVGLGPPRAQLRSRAPPTPMATAGSGRNTSSLCGRGRGAPHLHTWGRAGAPSGPWPPLDLRFPLHPPPQEMRNHTYLALETFVDGGRRPHPGAGGRSLATIAK